MCPVCGAPLCVACVSVWSWSALQDLKIALANTPSVHPLFVLYCIVYKRKREFVCVFVCVWGGGGGQSAVGVLSAHIEYKECVQRTVPPSVYPWPPTTVGRGYWIRSANTLVGPLWDNPWGQALPWAQTCRGDGSLGLTCAAAELDLPLPSGILNSKTRENTSNVAYM